MLEPGELMLTWELAGGNTDDYINGLLEEELGDTGLTVGFFYYYYWENVPRTPVFILSIKTLGLLFVSKVFGILLDHPERLGRR